MAKYRKKTVVFEAKQYTINGLEAERVADWCGGDQVNTGCLIATSEGPRLARYGDWIIKGVNGKFSPCKPDLFDRTYELVD